MAREAWEQSGEGWVHPDWFEDRAKALKTFEALVRADERNRTWTQEHWTEYERSIAAAEREACAKLCENEWSNVAERMYGQECAAAIRARGNT
jgi:hypothetical protein